MISDSYLYGVEVEVPEIPAEVVMRRVELLTDHLTILMDTHYSNRDETKVRAVHKALEFWSKINETK